MLELHASSHPPPSRPASTGVVRQALERAFAYRGVILVELPLVHVDGGHATIVFYARRVALDGERPDGRSPGAVFVAQMLRDAVTILKTVWRAARHVDVIRLTVLADPIALVSRQIEEQ